MNQTRKEKIHNIIPLIIGVFFGTGIMLYSLSPLTGNDHEFVLPLIFMAGSYLFLLSVAVAALMTYRQEAFVSNSGRFLKLLGFFLILLSFLSMIPLHSVMYMLSVVFLYGGISLTMLGIHLQVADLTHYLSQTGVILAIAISFMSIIQFLIIFHIELNFFWIILGIGTATLCILSGYHSSRMLKEDNHD